MARKKVKKNYVYASGRRKTASARVRLFKGTKESTVNNQLVGKYFVGPTKESVWQKPFKLTDTFGKYYFTAKVIGGGQESQ